MAPDTLTVLITSAGSTAAQNLARVLARAGWGVLGGDMRSDHAGLGLYDRDLLLPRGDDPGYIPALIAHIRAHGVGLLVPVMAPELRAVSRARAALEAGGCRVICAPAEAVDVCLSKRRLADALAEAGVPQPRPLTPSAIREFPVFARPDGGTGSRGARRVDDAEALARLRATAPGLVFTEHCEATEYSVDGFAWPPGRLVHAICRSRDEVRGGLVVRSRVEALGERLALVAWACEALGLAGFFNLQFFQESPGAPCHVFDVNPRLGGGMILSFEAGLDAPTYLADLAAGRSPPPGGAERVGLRLIRRWENVLLESDDV